jgi:hypothetical protein
MASNSLQTREEGEMAMQQQEPYSVRSTVDYPDRPLDRPTTGFRIFMAIPMLTVLGTVSGGTWQWLLAIPHYIVLFFLEIAAVVVVMVAWVAMLFTGRYPRGMFDLYPPFRLAQ